MKRYVESDKIIGGTFIRFANHMNTEQCGFVSAFRNEYTYSENLRRNKELSKDIQDSDLSYIKVKGGYVEKKAGTDDEFIDVVEDTYCIINSCMDPDDFIEFMVGLCKKYDQESVLITTPVDHIGRMTRERALNIIGAYYYKDGKPHETFNNANLSTVEKYFTKVHGKKFALSNKEPEAVKGSVIDIYSPYGRHAAHIRYMQKYKKT